MATKYVVLVEVDDGKAWDELARVEAPTARKARELGAELANPEAVEAGIYLKAVPARNWDGGGGEVKAETTRRIRSA